MVSRDAVIPANADGDLTDRRLDYDARQSPGKKERRGDKRPDEARALIEQSQPWRISS